VPETDGLRRALPEARIISEALWKAAHDRIARTRKAFAAHRSSDGKLQGRPESALVREHLLSGFLRCGVCGGNLFLFVSKAGKNPPSKLFYTCTTNFKRGASRCANNVRVPYEDITSGVIDAFESRISDREVIEKFLFAEREASSVESVAQQRAILEADLAALDREIKRLIALADGDDDLEELKVRLGTKKAARSEKVARLEALASRQNGDSPAVVFATWFREWLPSTSPEAFWDAPKAPVARCSAPTSPRPGRRSVASWPAAPSWSSPSRPRPARRSASRPKATWVFFSGGWRSRAGRRQPPTPHLVDSALVTMDALHHPFEHRVEDLSRLLGITVGEQLHRALEVGE